MKIEKAPSNIRTMAACLWIIPAIILSYLFQNREELFLLEICYLSTFIGNLGFFSDEFPVEKLFTITSVLPCVVNSYYFSLLFPFSFRVSTLSDILQFVVIIILFSIPTLLIIAVVIIPIFTFPVFLIAQLFMSIADAIYSFLKESQKIYKVFAISIIVSLILLISITVPSNFYVAPLPARTASSQEEQEETETVYISTYGKCYHSNPRCSGMKYASPVTLSTAKKSGRSACSKCYRKKHK